MAHLQNVCGTAKKGKDYDFICCDLLWLQDCTPNETYTTPSKYLIFVNFAHCIFFMKLFNLSASRHSKTAYLPKVLVCFFPNTVAPCSP